MRILLLAFLLLSLSASLVAQESPTSPFEPFAIPAHPGWKKAVEAGTRQAHGAPGDSYWTNYADYQIKARLDPASAMLSGEGRYRYRNNSPKDIRQLQLHLRQNLHKEGIRRTRTVEITGGLELTKIELNGQPLPRGFRRGYRISGSILRIRLPEKLAPGESVELELAWNYKVPRAGKAPRNGHEKNRVFYLGYWYPQFAVFDDVEGWVADQYLGNGEFYMGYADYMIEMEAPVGFLVRSTGVLQNPKEVLTPEAVQALERVATTKEVVSIIDEAALNRGEATRRSESGQLTWKFRARNVRDVAISISDRYLWDAARARTKKGESDDCFCTVHAVYEANAKAWKKAAEYSRATIEYMSREVYPYPWPHMTACEGVIGGGMEFPMMTIVGSNSESGTRGTIAHEIIHMWFPMIVGQNEKRYAWMDEGMTSFFTSRVVNAILGIKRPGIPVRGYLASAGRPFEEPCIRHADRYNQFSGGFRTAAYSKPAAVFHQLRAMVGPDKFDAALSAYVADWAYKHPYPEDFFARLESEIGQDLDWYFRTWMYETWTLDQAVVAITPAEQGRSRFTIQNLSTAVGPTTIEVEFTSGRKERLSIPVSWWMKGHPKKTLEVAGEIKSVTLDPEFLTLDTNRANNRMPPLPKQPRNNRRGTRSR